MAAITSLLVIVAIRLLNIAGGAVESEEDLP